MERVVRCVLNVLLFYASPRCSSCCAFIFWFRCQTFLPTLSHPHLCVDPIWLSLIWFFPVRILLVICFEIIGGVFFSLVLFPKRPLLPPVRCQSIPCYFPFMCVLLFRFFSSYYINNCVNCSVTVHTHTHTDTV